MKKISNYYDFILLYYGTNNEYWPIEYNILIESDFQGSPFFLLNYPKNILGDISNIEILN